MMTKKGVYIFVKFVLVIYFILRGVIYKKCPPGKFFSKQKGAAYHPGNPKLLLTIAMIG